MYCPTPARLILATAFVLLAALLPASAHSAALAQSTTPQTILNQSSSIREWTVNSGFIYWHESCRPHLSETTAFLRRRPVNGVGTQTMLTINHPTNCETLLGVGVDNSGVYYYNRAAGTIEAIYTDAPTAPPTTLATVGRRTAVGFGDAISAIYPHGDYVYWFEIDGQGEFVPDDVRLRRVSKQGGSPATILEYAGYFAGRSLAFHADHIWWIDSDGLQRMPVPPCSGGCEKTLVHETIMRGGRLTINNSGDIIWFDATPTADRDFEILRTRCANLNSCTTVNLHTTEDRTPIRSLVISESHIYWSEVVQSVGPRLRRLPISGGSPSTLVDDDINAVHLAIDTEGIYYPASGRQSILRIPLDVAAIAREISVGGWEVTQAIQNLDNAVPLVAGKTTFVRIYPVLDSGTPSAGVEALLHGSRGGEPLDGSPLRPLYGTLAVTANTATANRGEIDGGWLFELPGSWTKDTDAALPLEDATLTLRAELDPRDLTGDTTPANNSREETFSFIAKAPTCVNLRSVWTEARYQSPWDISVASVMELSESVHPTVRILPFPEFNRLEKIEWCWKGPIYGPFCSGPYTDLDADDTNLLTKMGMLDFFHSSPSVCFATGARTLYAGIVSPETPWEWGGLARVGKDQSLNKVPRYGTWSWPLTRRSGRGMTFVHEIGHNYGRRHIDCGDPKKPDLNYPYATDTLDDRPVDAPTTHFGFDTRMLEPIAPDTNRDYMSYCGPRWVSDYTWNAIFNNTRAAGPIFPAAMAQEPAEAYVFVSGLITPTLSQGELGSTWTYPSAEAGDILLHQWQAATVPPWTDEPYHVRLVDAGGTVLADRVVELVELSEEDENDVLPFNIVFPAPEGMVHAVQLLQGETILASRQTGTSAPTVTIQAPAGGETVEDTFTLQWTASDPDNPPWLLYTIQYSPDLGETWYSLAVELPGVGKGEIESRELDLRGQPGTEGPIALLRILASDGYHTGIATSAPFTVLPRSPHVLITAPEAGQWFAAGEPVPLRGDAFDPEDGILPDPAFTWTWPGFQHNGRIGTAMGLAPGAYTATLQATDSDAQQGSAQVSFQIAPLEIPLATTPTLDGKCTDLAYASLILPLTPYANGARAQVALARTDDYLWICFMGLEGAGEYAGLQIDVDNSQESTPQPGDRAFFVQLDGTPIAQEGIDGAFVATSITGMAAQIQGDSTAWSAELRLDAEVIGGWNRRVALSLGHYHTGETFLWPATAQRDTPQSWAQTNLGAGELPTLTALSPISAAVGMSTTVTLTGTAFTPDTIVLWNGTVITPTYIDDSTLHATLDAELLSTAGYHDVQVAPAHALELASLPLAFLVNHPQPAITALTPDTLVMGDDGFTLVVQGGNFAPGAVVLWNGEERLTTFVDATRLEAQIDAADVANARPVRVAIANPTPSVQPSAAATFTITPPDTTEDGFPLYLPYVDRE